MYDRGMHPAVHPAAQAYAPNAAGVVVPGPVVNDGGYGSGMNGRSMNFHVMLERAVRNKRVEDAWRILEEMQAHNIVGDMECLVTGAREFFVVVLL